MAADSIGVTPRDTGEFLLGTVLVTPVFIESDGSIDPETQNWTAAEIDEMLAKVRTGVDWWTETLDRQNTVHSLDFVIDDTFARDPFESPYEPIDRNTSAVNEYVGHFVTELGYGDSLSIEDAVQRFNHDQRAKFDTDWSFTIFVVDSSDDPDGLFASGGFGAAFAYAGGLFMVTPSTRPASTITHEMGHIFWARDEYPGGGSFTDTRGYYDTQNLNASDNPTPGFIQDISIMRGGIPLTAAYDAHYSPASTFAMVGWQDSDGDGIFDLADVPLELDGVGYFDAATSTYHFRGTAAAVPLRNQNSSGVQSDITLNRVSELQYRVDGGDWITAATPASQHATLNVSFPIGANFTDIELRVIDTAVGVQSPVFSGTNLVPATSTGGVHGIAFLDADADGIRDLGETTLVNAAVTVTRIDGPAIATGQAAADQFGDDPITEDQTIGMTLSADGLVSDTIVASREVTELDDRRVFATFDLQRNRWTERLSSKVSLVATMEEPTGQVDVRVIGLDDSSFARIEAYDINGILIGRQTSTAMALGEDAVVSITDDRGSIASVHIYGHANSSIAVDQVVFGVVTRMVTDASGAFRFDHLADGDYRIEVQPERLIHAYTGNPMMVTVVGGTSTTMAAGAVRVDSPRHNSALAYDANGDGKVSAADALVIINDLARNKNRILGEGELVGLNVDVSNDGGVSALDALLVINQLSKLPSGEGEFELDSSAARITAVDGALADWPAVVPGSASYQSLPLRLAETSKTTQSDALTQPESPTNAGAMFNFVGHNAAIEVMEAGFDGEDAASGGRSNPAMVPRTAMLPDRGPRFEQIVTADDKGESGMELPLFAEIGSQLVEPIDALGGLTPHRSRLP